MAWPTKTDFVDGDVLTAAQVNNIGTNLNIFNPTSATNGQIWVANGSGSGSFTTVASGSMTSIASGSLSGSSLDLTSISGSYKDLKLVVQGFRNTSTSTYGLRINNNTAAEYSYVFSGNYDANDRLNVRAASKDRIFQFAEVSQTGSATAGATNQMVVEIINYADSGTMRSKQIRFYTQMGQSQGLTIGCWDTNATSGAINRLTIVVGTGSFAAGTYILYGVN